MTTLTNYLAVKRMVRGAPIYDGCSNTEIIVANRKGRPCFFRMSALERELYKAKIAKNLALAGGVEGFKLTTGCQLDCKPFSKGSTTMRMKSVERSTSVDTTMVNEDGSRPVELHVKIDPEVDGRGHPVFDVVEDTGCPFFATGLDPARRG